MKTGLQFIACGCLLVLASCASSSFRSSLTAAEVDELSPRVAALVPGMSREQVAETLRMPNGFHWSTLDFQDGDKHIQPIRLNDEFVLTLCWSISNKTLIEHSLRQTRKKRSQQSPGAYSSEAANGSTENAQE